MSVRCLATTQAPTGPGPTHTAQQLQLWNSGSGWRAMGGEVGGHCTWVQANMGLHKPCGLSSSSLVAMHVQCNVCHAMCIIFCLHPQSLLGACDTDLAQSWLQV